MKKKLSKDDVTRLTEEIKKVHEKKYRVGRKIVQVRDYYGLRAGRVGWVTDVWPRTRILFEDGREPDIHAEFCSVLEETDDYIEDVDALRESISNKKRAKRRTIRKIR